MDCESSDLHCFLFESELISAYLKFRQPRNIVTSDIFNVREILNNLHAVNYLKIFRFWNTNKKQVSVIGFTDLLWFV